MVKVKDIMMFFWKVCCVYKDNKQKFQVILTSSENKTHPLCTVGFSCLYTVTSYEQKLQDVHHHGGGGKEGTVMTEEPLTGRGYRRVCILATRQHVFHTQTHTHLRIRSLMHNNEQGKTLICAVAQAGPHSLGAEDKWRGNTLG